jgi:hypothetical protein
MPLASFRFSSGFDHRIAEALFQSTYWTRFPEAGIDFAQKPKAVRVVE